MQLASKAMMLGGVAMVGILTASLVGPVLAQESILPPGFEQPASRPAPQRPSPPRPAPTPSPTVSPQPRPSATLTNQTSPRASALPAPPVPIGGAAIPPSGTDAALAAGMLPPAPPRYDLPPGSRRSLRRVGPLTPESGGLAPNAFGNRGRYLMILMDRTRQPIVSRWGGILLRRAMLSAVDTPANVNGADFTASRAWLLLGQGESVAARMLVQSVDVDKATPRMRSVAMQVYLANGDPAGLCPYAPAMAGPDKTWQLVQAMCSSLVAEPGTATAIIERVRRSGQLQAIDVKLAEKIVGAGSNSNRSAIIRWDGVEQLTLWRFGLASATGVPIPDTLWQTATPAMRRWAVQLPMIDIDRRLASASEAASGGGLSARGYVNLVSFAAAQDEPSAATAGLADAVRGSFVYSQLSDRLAAIVGLATSGTNPYAGKVLAARAAARVGPTDIADDEGFQLIAAMFAGGLDNNAMAWAPRVAVGSQAWGLLSVGSPRPLVGVSGSNVRDFADSDDSVGALRTRFLAAALIGLDRVGRDDANGLASDHRLALSTSTRWTRAITLAAQRGEPGTVALLAAVGLQGRSWADVPPYHLYHITTALRRVGLGAEARMIAAEALSRV